VDIMSEAASGQRTEVIVFCSGKGGTGKTSLISALGYALRTSGHRVLFIDADRATDGLSLFVLGPEGRAQLAGFDAASTFTGLLAEHERTGALHPAPRGVHRTRDHGLSYDVIISDRYLYGDSPQSDAVAGAAIDRQFQRASFQRAVLALFEDIRSRDEYDYVLVDSRGGFSFESTDIAAAGDSFVVVTEATFTNFYQDRNLVDRISEAAEAMGRKAVLRGIIVNKSTEPGEVSYRNELVREFGVRFEDTYPVAIDLDALRAYKQQLSVFREAPASAFAHDALQAFQRILRVVTSRWSADRVERWDKLIGAIDAAIAAHNAEIDAQRRAQDDEKARIAAIEAERDSLRAELDRTRAANAQEQRRQDILLTELRGVSRAGKTARSWALLTGLAAAAMLAGVGWYALAGRARDNPGASATPYPTPAPVQVDPPAPTAMPDVASAQKKMAPPVPPSDRSAAPAADEPVMNVISASPAPGSAWLKPCIAGTYNVIVASGYHDTRAAEVVRNAFAHDYPEFEFKTVTTVSNDKAGNLMQAVFAGQGLSRDEANELLARIRRANFVDGAYITQQTFDCAGSARRAPAKPPLNRLSGQYDAKQ
jgi:cellulose biosynthesis protein BcsQ